MATSPEALRRHLRASGADYLTDPHVTRVRVGLRVVDRWRTDRCA